MKHLLTLCLLLFLGTCFSQGNLQFNQVLTFTGTVASNNGFVNSAINTVPAGKVWKIEFKEGGGLLNVNGMNLSLNQLPCWLKNGDIVALNGNNSSTQNIFVSIIEFNIVP